MSYALNIDGAAQPQRAWIVQRDRRAAIPIRGTSSCAVYRRSVMRATHWARWATCALAISICVPAALADRGTKSVSTCTTFDQADKGENKVEFTIRNSCTIPVDCSISWRVICAPDSKKRRAVHAGATKLLLGDATSQSADASAAVCGDDSWSIDNIQWACQPNKE
jgi:hypothetical protein